MAKPVHTASQLLANQIVQFAFTTGQIHTEGTALKSALNNTVCDFEPYVNFFVRLNQHRKDGVALIESADRVNSLASDTPYLLELGSKLDRCYDELAYPLFSRIIHLQSEKVDDSLKLLEQACNRQQEPINTDLVKKQIFQLRLIPIRCDMELNPDQKSHLKKIDTLFERLYCAQEGFVNLDSARQSTIEACGPNDEAIVKTMAEEEDRLGKAAASPNSQNLTERGIIFPIHLKEPSSDDDIFYDLPQSVDLTDSDSSTSSSLNSSWAQLEFPPQEALNSYSQLLGSDPNITGQGNRQGIDHG